MTDTQINTEAEDLYDKYNPICHDRKEAWMKAYMLAYKNGQIEGMSHVIKKVI